MDLVEFSDSVSLSPLILRVALVVFLLRFGCTPVTGELRVVGPSGPVTASPGDDVILPCHVEPPLDVARLTVEWTRPDVQPDPNDRLSGVDYVHLYRDRREVPDMKLASYVSRTLLFTDGLRRGNISLKIINVTLEDEGSFRCFLPKLKSRIQSSVVNLLVVPKSVNSWTTETPQPTTRLQTPDPAVKGDASGRSRLIPLLVFLLMILCAAFAACFSRRVTRCQKQELMKPPDVSLC